MLKKVSSQPGILRVTFQVWSIGQGSLDSFDIQCVKQCVSKNVIKSVEHEAHNLLEQISTLRCGEGYYSILEFNYGRSELSVTSIDCCIPG